MGPTSAQIERELASGFAAGMQAVAEDTSGEWLMETAEYSIRIELQSLTSKFKFTLYKYDEVKDDDAVYAVYELGVSDVTRAIRECLQKR